MALGSSTAVAKRKRELFLEHLRKTGHISDSAKHAGYSTSSKLHELRRQDEDFARQWDEAVDVAVSDVLESTAWDRAVDGVKKGIYYQGERVDTEKIYSDQLLMFLLKANRPKKYRETMNVHGEITGTFGVAVLPMVVSESEWEKEARQLHKDLNAAPEKIIEHSDVDEKTSTLKRA